MSSRARLFFCAYPFSSWHPLYESMMVPHIVLCFLSVFISFSISLLFVSLSHRDSLLSVSLPLCFSVSPSLCLSLRLSVSVSLSVSLYFCLSVYTITLK